MSKFRLSNLAKSDLKDIYKYGSRTWGRKQAAQYDQDLRSAAKTAALFANLGRPYTTAKGTEFKRYNSGRHVLFYVTENDRIFVVRILHDRMDFDRHLD